MKIVIIGCPRSGTLYTSKIFKASGLDVGHEKWGKDGIVSWFNTIEPLKCDYTLSTCRSNKIKKIDKREYIILHQVRNPLKTIASMHSISNISWDYVYKELDISREKSCLYRCMQFWLMWNQKAEVHAYFTFRVENMDKEWPLIMRCMGTTNVFNKGYLGIHSRKHREVTWDDLYNEDEYLAKSIENKSRSYGYG